MSDAWFSRANEKLHFAKLILQQSETHASADRLSAHALRLTISEACVFHLQGALHAFCNEIAASIGEPPVADLPALEAACLRRGSDLEAVRELLILQRDTDSWLHALEQAWSLCWKPREVPKREANAGIGGIVVCVETSAQLPDAATCQRWLKSMQETFEHLREGMQEW